MPDYLGANFRLTAVLFVLNLRTVCFMPRNRLFTGMNKAFDASVIIIRSQPLKVIDWKPDRQESQIHPFLLQSGVDSYRNKKMRLHSIQ